MKILLLDVETSPNTVFVWGLFGQNISIDKIVDSSRVMCWSAKWYGETKMHFASEHTSTRNKMLRQIHQLLEEADAVVSYNGTSFDLPVLNREFVVNGMKPPAPYKQIDLLGAVRKAFRFPSNKLQYVSGALKLGQKTKHSGFELWISCMQGDPKAWKKMTAYNKQDVVLLEKLYDRIKPWLPSHPNHRLFDEGAMCPNCGSAKHQRRGYAVTNVFRYARYQCECGTWFRSTKSVRVPGGGERYVQAR